MLPASADRDLSHGAFRLLRILSQTRTRRDRRGRVIRRVGQNYLANRCGHVSTRTIRRYLAELERAGRVTRVRHRRERHDGRWVSVECQSYVLADPVSAGHTNRTRLSGPPFGGVAPGSPKRPAAAPRPRYEPPERVDVPREVREAGMAMLRGTRYAKKGRP